ncbi:outer dense fiber protein 2-like isoform X2 [Oscarella lobularis]|uniref:outer dense fiber protein 2-like isoform X2 n=1 Tax=Oscarella lobularis TaxID=121494 RepID=UPI003314409A
MGDERSRSPLHVHVGQGTPVHVHLKKKKPSDSYRSGTASRRSMRSSFGRSARSSRPVDGPWVPPPGKSTRGAKASGSMMWQGPSHRLEINKSAAAADGTELRMSDLSSETGSDVIRGYEKKIDTLMTEVGELKNEVDLQRSIHEVEKKTNELRESQRRLTEKEDEIDEYRAELNATEMEASKLRHSIDKLREDVENTRTNPRWMSGQREVLLKKLVEAEVDGEAAAKQAQALRDSVKKLERSRLIPASTASEIRRQKDLLGERIRDFETTNKTLRKMLRQYHKHEISSASLNEQKLALLSRIGEADELSQRLKDVVRDKDRKISEMAFQLEADKTLESARIRLQEQLSIREGENRTLRMRLESLEQQLSQEKAENAGLEQMLDDVKRDKEALKRATKHQKERATRGAETIESMSSQLAHRDAELAEVRALLDQARDQNIKLTRAKARGEGEIAGLSSRIEELEHVIESTKSSSKASLATQSEETQRQKALVRSLEEQLSELQQDSANKLARCKRELEDQVQEVQRVRQQGELDKERVRLQLQQRASELEPLPELLKASELRLQDAQDRLSSYEKKMADHTQLIGELTAKVESQSQQLDSWRDKWHSLLEENRTLSSQGEGAERKLIDVEQHNRELVSLASRKEESLQKSQTRIEELSHEIGSLKRQLDNSLSDSRRQMDEVKERYAAKERTSQARITDLETQLSRVSQSNSQLRRDKDETERRSKSRIYDLQDRLEQSQNTNRNMESYVKFLKASYANVYGDSPLSTTIR